MMNIPLRVPRGFAAAALFLCLGAIPSENKTAAVS